MGDFIVVINIYSAITTAQVVKPGSIQADSVPKYLFGTRVPKFGTNDHKSADIVLKDLKSAKFGS